MKSSHLLEAPAEKKQPQKEESDLIRSLASCEIRQQYFMISLIPARASQFRHQSYEEILQL